MQYFVQPGSVVRSIWGKADTIIFIFAGAAAEFALNKAVDWLYFTGRLPADPIGRLFSTVNYARDIVFSDLAGAKKAIERINHIHGAVEKQRGSKIPDWAYRDVLYMLIDYSIVSFELLERKLMPEEKEEVFAVFYRVGQGMQIAGLPAAYAEWLPERERHLQQDLEKTAWTEDLFRQYKKHLGSLRYLLLTEGQKLVVPERVRQLLGWRKASAMRLVLPVYQLAKKMGAAWFLKSLVLPAAYKQQIRELDRV